MSVSYAFLIRSIRVIRVLFALRLTPLPVCRERSNVQKEEEHLVDVPRYICPLAYAAIPFVGIAQTYCIILLLLKG